MKKLIEKYLAELTSRKDESQWTAENDMRDWRNAIKIIRKVCHNPSCRNGLSLDDGRMLDSILDKYISMLEDDAAEACEAKYSLKWERDFMLQLEAEGEFEITL